MTSQASPLLPLVQNMTLQTKQLLTDPSVNMISQTSPLFTLAPGAKMFFQAQYIRGICDNTIWDHRVCSRFVGIRILLHTLCDHTELIMGHAQKHKNCSAIRLAHAACDLKVLSSWNLSRDHSYTESLLQLRHLAHRNSALPRNGLEHGHFRHLSIQGRFTLVIFETPRCQ